MLSWNQVPDTVRVRMSNMGGISLQVAEEWANLVWLPDNGLKNRLGDSLQNRFLCPPLDIGILLDWSCPVSAK